MLPDDGFDVEEHLEGQQTTAWHFESIETPCLISHCLISLGYLQDCWLLAIELTWSRVGSDSVYATARWKRSQQQNDSAHSHHISLMTGCLNEEQPTRRIKMLVGLKRKPLVNPLDCEHLVTGNITVINNSQSEHAVATGIMRSGGRPAVLMLVEKAVLPGR